MVATESKDKEILLQTISKERNIFVVAERFILSLIKVHGKHLVSADDGGTWYPQQACKFLELDHHIHSIYEKSIIERTIQYIKNRIESYDDYFPCIKKKCNMEHVRNWLNLFADFHNSELYH